MIINKLLPSMQPPLNIVKGSVNERTQKAFELTENLYQKIQKEVKDDYSIIHYDKLEKDIKDALPVDNYNIVIKNIKPTDQATYDGLCIGVTNKNNDITSLSIELEGISNSIRTCNIPVFVHEFQHAADELYNPKYISRNQKLLKKGLDNDKYNEFYDDYYYCPEYAKSRKKRRYVLKVVKKKTLEFLKDFSISDKIDYLQDIRYSLMSEINAYQTERKAAAELRSKGFSIKDFNLDNYPALGLFREKINLVKQLAAEYISQERKKHKEFIQNI